MGSTQSRKSKPNFVNSDVKIIITEPEQEEIEEEFFECVSNNDDLKCEKSLEDADVRLNFEVDDEKNEEECKINLNKENEQTQREESADESSDERSKRQQREMDEFRDEINRKRTLRQQCIKKLRDKLKDLNDKLDYQLMVNEQLQESIDRRVNDASSTEVNTENKNLKIELAECQMYLQKLNGENLNFTMENQALRDHIRSLKEVNKAMKEMLNIRELQVDQLKAKLEEIECSFSDKETKILSTDLKQEYQRQLENIRNMRVLYEERSNLLLQENNTLKQQFSDKEHDYQIELEKSKRLEEYIATLESNLNVKNTDISMVESQLSQLRSDKLQIEEEMNAVNQLISQILFDFNDTGKSLNFDMLHNMLEEHRDFLKEMTMKEDYGGIDGGSFLPKILYDLFLQANNEVSNDNACENVDKQKSVNTPEEIASKLPKVWRVLIELFNHHNKLKEEDEENAEKANINIDECYKLAQTSTGSQPVLSVSKTFIKLQDLIFEKRSLQKDTTRLKTLYSHLEQRLDKQEKKLSAVSLELTKTWHLVGKIKRQHRQLHTHEQILCYQLQQKRRVLNELKAELEYCRKKWALARAINKESEKQCQELRHEFLLRKIQDQNSAESGYSDGPSDGDECDNNNKKMCRGEVKERFEKNLSNFDRTIYQSDRRGSLELPILFKLLSSDVPPCRAQSEPPISFDVKEARDSDNSVSEQDFSTKSEVAVEIEQHHEVLKSENVQVSLPPDVHEHNSKKNSRSSSLKCHLEKSKKHKRKRTNDQNIETAEEMFYRLFKSINGEVSSASEENDEDSENIEEIPFDNVMENDLTNDEVEKIEEIPVDSDMENNSMKIDDPNLPTCSGTLSKLESIPSTSSPTQLFEDDYLKNREARLARLEAETKEFYEKMTRDKKKRAELNNRLTSVHNNFLEREKNKSESLDSESTVSENSQENTVSQESTENQENIPHKSEDDSKK